MFTLHKPLFILLSTMILSAPIAAYAKDYEILQKDKKFSQTTLKVKVGDVVLSKAGVAKRLKLAKTNLKLFPKMISWLLLKNNPDYYG